jgi:hypothetical protein
MGKTWIAVPNCMEQNPNLRQYLRLANQEIIGHVWNPQFHYRVPKDPPLRPVLNQFN